MLQYLELDILLGRMTDGMKKKEYEVKRKCLLLLFVLVSLAFPGICYLLTSDVKASFLILAAFALAGGMAALLHYLDDSYITDVVVSLSELTDTLIDLEEKEIFPDTEDSVLAKLQSKVIKQVRILKYQKQKAIQEQENIKGLVSDISHQLKTPIANLKMYSQFLEDDSLSEEKQREYKEIIRISVERLYFLTENMIKISRLESGLISLDREKQSLNETVLKAVKDVYFKARKKGIEIVYQETEEICIIHDRKWTAEAVFNLLDNGVKYAKEGNQIFLSIKKLGMFVEVSVEDENGAIPEEERSKIFTRFYRGSHGKNQEGIGIGLYLSREIAMKQGGYMNLKTTIKGNIFSLALYIEHD